MNQCVVDSLEITNVSNQVICEDQINLTFTLEGKKYYMFFRERRSIYRPFGISHDFDGRCPFCEDFNINLELCDVLNQHINLMYDRLIEHPAVRLEWLYIPHGEYTGIW